MKIHRFADRKKELFALILVGLIVVFVAIYVVFLVNGLTAKVYKVFGQPADPAGAFTHFDFAKFEELGLRPKKVTTTPIVAPAPVVPITPSTTMASGTASSS